jgi:hypothetical protein
MLLAAAVDWMDAERVTVCPGDAVAGSAAADATRKPVCAVAANEVSSAVTSRQTWKGKEK